MLMMMHPIFTTLATRPELLAEHLGAYAALASAEAGAATQALRMRAWLIGLLLFCLGLGLALGGMALLLWAALPLQQMPRPWLLPLLPGALLVSAGLCWLGLRRRPRQRSFQALREQLSLDAALLREAGRA